MRHNGGGGRFCHDISEALAMICCTQSQTLQPSNEFELRSLPGVGVGIGIPKMLPGRRATLKNTPHFT